MKHIIVLVACIIVISCGAAKKENSIEMISASEQQDSIFRDLIIVTGDAVPDSLQGDSLAFLVLPLQASCPACRNKTIDSIAEHANSLLKNHYVVISANGGHKTINGYFQENDKKMPDMGHSLILDSNNLAHKYELYDKKPTMYYTYNRKAFKKVAAVPATVRDDLREFFSGLRTNEISK